MSNWECVAARARVRNDLCVPGTRVCVAKAAIIFLRSHMRLFARYGPAKSAASPAVLLGDRLAKRISFFLASSPTYRQRRDGVHPPGAVLHARSSWILACAGALLLGARPRALREEYLQWGCPRARASRLPTEAPERCRALNARIET